jgi:hypothetical protein
MDSATKIDSWAAVRPGAVGNSTNRVRVGSRASVLAGLPVDGLADAILTLGSCTVSAPGVTAQDG